MYYKMSINKAIKDLKWNYEHKWSSNITERDIEIYKTIVSFVETQHSINLSQNEALAKLWIHKLMLLNQTEMYSAKRAIEAIDEILSKSVYDWCKEMHTQANIMRFNTLLDSLGYKESLKQNKPVKMSEIGSKIIEGKEKEFETALKSEIKESDIIKFVEDNITRVLNGY